MRIRVDLPLPLGPSNPKIEFFGIEKETSFKALDFSKLLITLFNLIKSLFFILDP